MHVVVFSIFQHVYTDTVNPGKANSTPSVQGLLGPNYLARCPEN